MHTNGRDLINSMLKGERPSRLSWTTLVDRITLSGMPEQFRNILPIEFYKIINCDIVQFGNYGLQLKGVKHPYRINIPEYTYSQSTQPDGSIIKERKTPFGKLTARFNKSHPVEYPVKSVTDIKILTWIWKNTFYVEDGSGYLESLKQLELEIGDQGLYFPTIAASPVQELLEIEMGTENFYYNIYDYPEEMEDLMFAMHAARIKEYELVAKKIVSPAVIPLENTSTTYISPEIYRKYSLPQLQDYIKILHGVGKKCILHMCGLLHNLLPEINKTGLDGINGLTPAPVGDTDYEYALEMLGDNQIIMGILDPSLFHAQDVTRDNIWKALDRIYTPRLRKAKFILWLQADGLPTSLEKFIHVKDWFDENNK